MPRQRRSPLNQFGKPLAVSRIALPYLTPAKVVNVLHCEAEALRRAARPRSFPYIAFVDVVNACNLRCPYCPTGAQRESGRQLTTIDLAHVQRLLDELGDYLISANLFNWGEPLLHPQLSTIVEMIHQRQIFTQISTNLSLPKQDLLKDLCDAGLDYLTISMSGATQSVYEIHHRRGDAELVWDNIKRLVDYKRKRNKRRPLVEIKFLVFQHNRHELEAARELAAEYGVDIFNWAKGHGAEEVEIKKLNPVQTLESYLTHCHQLYHAVTLNADGGIVGCCYLYYKDDDFGDYARSSFRDIRQNWRFLTARQLFRPSAVGDLAPDMTHPCLKCHVVHKQAHLRSYLAGNPHAVQDHRTGGP